MCLTPPTEEFPWDDLLKNFRGCQRMAKVLNAVKILPKISTALERVHEHYRQTTDGRATACSEHEREFTFTKNGTK